MSGRFNTLYHLFFVNNQLNPQRWTEPKVNTERSQHIYMYAIVVKFHTLIQCLKVTIYTKLHTSELNIKEVIAPF